MSCYMKHCTKRYELFIAGSHNIDLVVTLGGDGTILHASSLFRQGPVPPMLSFSMGTLGFLLPFRRSKIMRLLTEANLSVNMQISTRSHRH